MQTGLAEQPREFAAVGQVGAAAGEQLAEAMAQPVGESLLGTGLIEADQGLEGRVGVLDQQPPAGRRELIIDRRALSRSGTWTRTSRAWTKSKPSPGGSSAPTS